MKIDKKTIDAIAALPDDKLWQMLSLIASASGMKLPREMPDKKTLAGIRGAAGEIGDGDIDRATEILSKYKEGRRDG